MGQMNKYLGNIPQCQYQHDDDFPCPLSLDDKTEGVLLDNTFSIIRFTPNLSLFFNVLEQDKGRSLLHFTYNFEYENLVEDLKFVILTLKPITKSIITNEGVFYQLTIQSCIHENGEKNVCLLFEPAEQITEIETIPLVAYDYESVFENSAFGMGIMEEGNRFVRVNPALCNMFGYNKEEFIGLTADDITFPADRNLKIDKRKQYNGVFSLIKRYVRKNGSIFFGKLTVTYVRDSSGKLTASLPCIEDITDFYESQKKLRASEAQFRSLFEHSPLGVAMTAIDGRIKEANPAFCKMLGYSKGETTQKRVSEISYVEDKKVEGFYADKIRKGEIDNYTIEKRFIKKDKTILWTNLSISVIRDKYNKILYIIGMIADISQQKKAELALIDYKNKLEETIKKRTEALQRSNEELSNFAHAASHDMKQPLRTMSSFAKLLQKRYSDKLDDRGHEYLNYIIDGAQNMSSLIHGLLEYAQFSFDKEDLFVRQNLNTILAVVRQNLRKQISENNVKIIAAELPSDTPMIIAKMIQLIQNLISNAIKFRPKNKKCVIQLASKDLGTHWQISIKDNGIGISTAHQKKIFDIFTKLHNSSEYKGNGIGLATCKRIVEQHQGKIWVESVEGEGATFHFTLKK